MVTKEEREQLIKQVMEKHEEAFFKTYGYVMTGRQKKELRKGAEKMVDREIKKADKLSF